MPSLGLSKTQASGTTKTRYTARTIDNETTTRSAQERRSSICPSDPVVSPTNRRKDPWSSPRLGNTWVRSRRSGRTELNRAPGANGRQGNGRVGKRAAGLTAGSRRYTWWLSRRAEMCLASLGMPPDWGGLRCDVHLWRNSAVGITVREAHTREFGASNMRGVES